MDAELEAKPKPEAAAESKPAGGAVVAPRPGERADTARGNRAWLGDAPSGQEAGTHVVSRIGVCRPDYGRSGAG